EDEGHGGGEQNRAFHQDVPCVWWLMRRLLSERRTPTKIEKFASHPSPKTMDKGEFVDNQENPGGPPPAALTHHNQKGNQGTLRRNAGRWLPQPISPSSSCLFGLGAGAGLLSAAGAGLLS